MNTNSVVKNGRNEILVLPIGYRFRPTDEELLIHYLKRKIFSFPLPASVISDHFDAFRTHPSRLPGDLNQKRYFFCKRINTSTAAAACSYSYYGYWKAMRKVEKVILSGDEGSKSNETEETGAVIGFKKSWVFYQAHNRTPWIMRQYRLNLNLKKCTTTLGVEEWVVCSIYQKKKKKKINKNKNKNKRSSSSSKLGQNQGATKRLKTAVANHEYYCDIETCRNAEEEEIVRPIDELILMGEDDSNGVGPPPSPSPSQPQPSGNTGSNGAGDEFDQEACSSPCPLLLSITHNHNSCVLD